MLFYRYYMLFSTLTHSRMLRIPKTVSFDSYKLFSRNWVEGKVIIFDDSFEHEVWHKGTEERLVLIVDVWHPELTPNERATLTTI